MAYQDYRNLSLWQKAMNMVVLIYQITTRFPAEERYALSDQLKRAAVSIPSNIAEGHGRNSVAEFAHFLNIAKGSLNEVSTQLEIAYRLNYITNETLLDINSQLEELSRMMYSLKQKLKTQN